MDTERRLVTDEFLLNIGEHMAQIGACVSKLDHVEQKVDNVIEKVSGINTIVHHHVKTDERRTYWFGGFVFVIVGFLLTIWFGK